MLFCRTVELFLARIARFWHFVPKAVLRADRRFWYNGVWAEIETCLLAENASLNR